MATAANQKIVDAIKPGLHVLVSAGASGIGATPTSRFLR